MEVYQQKNAYEGGREVHYISKQKKKKKVFHTRNTSQRNMLGNAPLTWDQREAKYTSRSQNLEVV